MARMTLQPFAPRAFRRRVFSQLWMLALQFVLGMVLNIIGSDTRGASHNLYIAVLIAHILNAIGLVEGAVYIALRQSSSLAWWTAAVIFATLCSGILAVRTGQDLWSFIMACGFLASAWLHVTLYVHADRLLHKQK